MPAYNARIALEAHNTASGALITNVLHAEADVLTDPPNWVTIAADVNSWLGTEWKNVLSTADTFDQIVVTDENYPGSTHGQGVFVVGAPGTRSVTTPTLDPALCRVVSWKTAVAKRYARGHSFLPPAYGAGALGSGGGWNPSDIYTVEVNAFINKYAAGFTAGSTGYIPIVFSRHRVDTAANPFTFRITGKTLSGNQHWLRSRSKAP